MDCQSKDDNTINHHANEEPQQKRRKRRQHDRYDEWVYIAQEEDLVTVKEALSSLDAAKRWKAMETEYNHFFRIKYGNYLNYLQEEKLLEVSGYSNESMMLMETLKDIKQGWLPKVIIRSIELIIMKYFVQCQDLSHFDL